MSSITMNNIQPSDDIFQEIKEKSIEIWISSDFHEDYIIQKISLINDLSNVKDDWSLINRMFDFKNQLRLYETLSIEALLFLYSMRNKYSIVFTTEILMKIVKYIKV